MDEKSFHLRYRRSGQISWSVRPLKPLNPSLMFARIRVEHLSGALCW